MRISSRKRIFSYPYPRRKHNRQLVSIPTSTKSMPSFSKFLLSNVPIYLDRALNRHPNSGIVLLGDLLGNQFNPGYLCSSFNLKKAVHSATRGNNTLDQIYTTLSDFYDPATILPPIGKSDHACVLLNPKMYCANSLPSRRTFERSCRPFEKQAFTESLSKINWRSLYNSFTPDEKITVFMTQVVAKWMRISQCDLLKDTQRINRGLLLTLKSLLRNDNTIGEKAISTNISFIVIKPGNCVDGPVVYFIYQM